jgi:acetyl esterase
MTVAAVRAGDCEVLALQRQPPALLRVEQMQIRDGEQPLTISLYRPAAGPLSPMLYLHGGGFVIDATGYDAPLRELAAATGHLIIAPHVRLAPEHQHPAAGRDASAALDWLLTHLTELGAREDNLVIAGDSSGGNLAAGLVQRRIRAGLPVKAQILIYPMLDATCRSASYQQFATGYGFSAAKSRWYFEQYLPAHVDRNSPLVSPLFAGDLAGLPRTLIVTAEFDPLRDDGERYARRLHRHGVEVDLRRYLGTIHGFFQMTRELPQSLQLIDDCAAWLNGDRSIRASNDSYSTL